MRQPFRILPYAVLAAMLPACVAYESARLMPEEELAALRAPDLTHVVVRRAKPGASDATTEVRPFDPSDGLDEAETVAVALTLNPALRATRLAVGEARALLITAGAWPNPELSAAWRAGIGGTSGYGVDADALVELFRPGQRAARRSAAAAAVDSARAEVVAQELETAGEVRTKRVDVLAAEQAVALLEEEAALRERALDLVRRQRRLGEGTELDVSTTELEAAEVARDLRKARAALDAERESLVRLLGLPPGYELRLAESGRPFAVTLFDDLGDEELDRRVLAGRPELRAAEAAHRQAEQELRLAVLGQYPGLRLGPAFERELEGSRSLGLGLSLELPVFDQNRGEVAEKLARRRRRRAEYAGLLHKLRADAFAARAGLRLAAREAEVQEREILPLVRRNQALFEGAFRARELNVIDWITSQQRTLRARREYLETLVRYRTAVIRAETATGMPLSQRVEAPPATRGGDEAGLPAEMR